MQHTIEFPAVALKNAFAGLSKIISSKSTLPVLGCVRVEADANGDARFQVTDLDSFATGHVQATSPGRFPACLIPFVAGFVLPITVLATNAVSYSGDATSPALWHAAGNSVLLAVLAAAVTVLLAVILAYARRIAGSRFVRMAVSCDRSRISMRYDSALLRSSTSAPGMVMVS